MDPKAKSTVCAAVYSQFPEVRGDTPQVKNLPGDKYQLIFQGTVKTENGKSLPRTVRVVANDDGRILKLSTSR